MVAHGAAVGQSRVELHSIADSVEIARGVKMPRLGLGTWKAHGGQLENAVVEAVRLGYRLFDTSMNYYNEEEVGAALARSGMPRDELFVTTKLEGRDQGGGRERSALLASLQRLGLDHLDLYLIHWPDPMHIETTWLAMEELQREGLTRAVGVSNFSQRDLDELLAVATIPPAVNQIELNPLRQRTAVRDYCRDAGITVEAWAPVLKGRAGRVPKLVRIAEAHRKTPVQVSLRWLLQKGVVAIPKTVHPERLRENADLYDFELSDEEVSWIDRLEYGEPMAL